ncbi:MAG: hypothetical protein AAF358_14165 [Pseudomonadota bacterium]
MTSKWPYLWAIGVGLIPEAVLAYLLALYIGDNPVWLVACGIWLTHQSIRMITSVFRALVFIITSRSNRKAYLERTAADYRKVGMPSADEGMGSYQHFSRVVDDETAPVEARIIAMGDLRTLESLIRFGHFVAYNELAGIITQALPVDEPSQKDRVA